MVQLAKVHWWYRVRRQLVRYLLSTYPPASGGTALLEVGCGSGDTLKMLSSTYSVRGIDASSESVALTQAQGVNAAQADATSIPAQDATSDVVIALDVLEHVQNPEVALAEIYRVLKPGGTLVVFVPAYMFLWSVTDELSHHYRRYTRRELVASVSATGFEVRRASYFNTLLFPLIAGTRVVVRLLGINMGSEMGTGTGLINAMLYYIFHTEVPLLHIVNFPFGVSIFLVATKH